VNEILSIAHPYRILLYLGDRVNGCVTVQNRICDNLQYLNYLGGHSRSSEMALIDSQSLRISSLHSEHCIVSKTLSLTDAARLVCDRIYVTVWCPSVRLSVPSVDRYSSVRRACCCGSSSSRCRSTAADGGRPAANVSSVTLSADVRS